MVIYGQRASLVGQLEDNLKGGGGGGFNPKARR